MLIDTHAHLYLPEFDQDREEMLKRAREVGVRCFLLPNIDEKSLPAMLNTCESFPDCLPMLGLHPGSVRENFRLVLDDLEPLLKQKKFYAIGEVGMDRYHDETFLDQQIEALQIQINWAVENDLPLVLHSRNAFEDVISALEKENKKLRGVFHCFTGTQEEAERIFALGFYIGIGGVVTYKNAGLDTTLKKLDSSRIILETDAPYLSPVPHRGKRNESAYLKLVANRLAEIWGISLQEVAKASTVNARNLFKLPDA